MREVAEQVFAETHQSAGLTGPLPATLMADDKLRDAVTIGASNFCPTRTGLRCRSGEPGAWNGRAAARAARVLGALGAPERWRGAPRFVARYRVVEKTAIGDQSAELSLTVDEEGADLVWSVPSFELRARTTEEGDAVTQPSGETEDLPLAGLDRVEALAGGEPVVLAEAVHAGLVSATAVDVPCDDAKCPALRVELPQGSVTLLILDPETHRPRFARTWWGGIGDGREADAITHYEAWRKVDGVAVVEKARVEGALEGDRRFELLEWAWEPR